MDNLHESEYGRMEMPLLQRSGLAYDPMQHVTKACVMRQ